MTETNELVADRMDHVATLTTDLCNAVLHARLAGHGVTNEQVHALAKAARLFQEEEKPWPPILEQVLHELTRSVADEDSEEVPAVHEAPIDLPTASLNGDEKGVKRFLNALKRKKD